VPPLPPQFEIENDGEKNGERPGEERTLQKKKILLLLKRNSLLERVTTEPEFVAAVRGRGFRTSETKVLMGGKPTKEGGGSGRGKVRGRAGASRWPVCHKTAHTSGTEGGRKRR